MPRSNFKGGSVEKRLYTGRRLQIIRKRHFQQNPLCVMCEAAGRIKLAQELDHIVALANGGEDVPENRQGLCRECHDAKTRNEFGWKPKPTIGLDGWPET
jgi:5-methylcytosine-specific restriction protein A